MQLALAGVCLLAGARLPAAPWIVKNGEARAEIVIAEQPARMTRLAARELQVYLAKISGATLPIVTEPTDGAAVRLYVGRSRHTEALGLAVEELRHGAFRISAGEAHLALLGPDRDYVPIEPYPRKRADVKQVLSAWDEISGSTFATPYSQLYRYYVPDLDLWLLDDAGTLNAVYEYLRGLGVRWYFPGELGEIVPQQADIALPAAPDRTVRPDFPLRNVMWWGMQHGLPAEEALWSLRLGINYGPDLLGLTQSCHGMKFVTTREEIKQAHPDYYALWNGRRATDHRECGAPCLSSDGLFDLHLRYVRAVFDHYREPMISLDLPDGSGTLCQCDLCKGRDAPARGWNGSLSDHVWGYIDRAARALRETHPGRRVSGLAYSAYLQPPEKIETLSPNIALLFCQTRSSFGDTARRDFYRGLREAWLQKLSSKELYLFEYHLQNRPGTATEGVPVYFPRLIAEDLRSLKGVSLGDTIDAYRPSDPSTLPYHAQAVMHLNWYVISRLWWDAELDLDALLDEYYRLFYGPARSEMQAFIEHAETNWTKMTSQVEPIDASLALLAKARAAAGDTVYGRRVDLLVDYLKPLQAKRETLAVGRAHAPQAEAAERDPAGLRIDGRLDEAFWEGVPEHAFKEIKTGAAPSQATTARFAWADRTLVVGIRCAEDDMANLVATTAQHDDANLWNDENIELLVETPAHAYYQIAVNPGGFILDMDRKTRDTLWNAEAEVAVQKDAAGWTVEMRLPTADLIEGGLDARRRIAGTRPTAEEPWYFNLYRHRVRERQVEGSAVWPTGGKLHQPLKFGKLVAK